MKKTNICQHMLDLIEKEKNLQLKVLFEKVDGSKITKEKCIKNLIKDKMIFDYKFEGSRFYELHPNHIFHKDIKKYAEHRIDELLKAVEYVEHDFVKCGISALVYFITRINDFDPEYIIRDMKNAKKASKYYTMVSTYQSEYIKKVSKIKNVTSSQLKELKNIYEVCIVLQNIISHLINKKENIKLLKKRSIINKEISTYQKQYDEKCINFDRIVTLIDIVPEIEYDNIFENSISKEQHTFNIKSDDTSDHVLDKYDKIILNLVNKYNWITNTLIIDALSKYRNIMSKNIIPNHIDHLLDFKKIYQFKFGARSVYMSDRYHMPDNSEYQIKSTCIKYQNELSKIKQEFSSYDIIVQRSVMKSLNIHFVKIIKIINSFKKFDEYEKNENCESKIMEIFDAINEQTSTDIEITHKNILDSIYYKCREIGDVVYELERELVSDIQKPNNKNIDKLLENFMNKKKSLEIIYNNNALINKNPDNIIIFSNTFKQINHLNEAIKKSQIIEAASFKEIYSQLHSLSKKIISQTYPISTIKQEIINKNQEIVKLKIKRNNEQTSKFKCINKDIEDLKKQLLYFYENVKNYNEIKSLISYL